MICPTCRQDFWALVVCDDGVYRCTTCRAARPKLLPIQISRRLIPPGKGTAHPKCSRAAAALEVERRKNHQCIKCGARAQEYSPGNFSVLCEAHNFDAKQKRRAAAERRRAS